MPCERVSWLALLKHNLTVPPILAERVWMVQTEQQYICIHQCLLAVLEGKENIVGPARVMDDNEGFEGT